MENKNNSNDTHICNNPNCNNESKLRCPNCKKLGIKKESYFCGKDCFTAYWSEHQKIHEQCIIFI